MDRLRLLASQAWAWCIRHCLALAAVGVALLGCGVALAISPPLRAQTQVYGREVMGYVSGKGYSPVAAESLPTGTSPSPTSEDPLASLHEQVSGLETQVGAQEQEIKQYRQEALELRDGLKAATAQAAQTNDLLEKERTEWLASLGSGGSAIAEASPSPATGNSVNPNTASLDELDAALPGIGPALAKRIVDYRTTNGPFKVAEDLLNVSGIGDALLAKIRGLLVFG